MAAKKPVAILVFAYKSVITKFEEISLRQLFKVLGKHPIVLICPNGLDIDCYKNIIPDLKVDYIDPKWLRSIESYNRLMIQPFLYEQYRSYEYVLIYQLDAFVFRDELLYWCGKGYDYIGAPWFEGWDRAAATADIVGAGNGGFSLRRVDALLKAARSFSWITRPSELMQKRGFSFLGKVRSLVLNTTIKNNSFYWFNTYAGYEDIYWAVHISKNFAWFKSAPAEEAARFSFEVNPRLVMEKHNIGLPFGCHAWARYEPEFWKPFIEREGYRWPDAV